jgi:arylsulfatase A-like enzyme
VTERPNFVLFITDQHRADYLGCYGHKILKTPHIDSIAERGVRFDNFYVSNPVCMPNRATLMTGRTPSVHGVRHNGIPLSLQSNTFVKMMHEGGYRTALIGKSHLQNFTDNAPMTTPAPAPEGYTAPPGGLEEARLDAYRDGDYGQEKPAFWESPEASVQLPYYGFDHVDMCYGHGDQVGGDYAHWLRAQRADGDELRGPKNSLPHDYSVRQAWRTALPEELYPTAYIAQQSDQWVRDYAASGEDAPFFLMASFPDPHHPFTPPGHYWDLYRPEDMEAPESYSTNDWTPPPHVAALLAARDEGKGPEDGIMSYGITLREALEARALTCGMIAMVDDAVGRVLLALKESGYADNTVILFTSDHGDHLGDHSMLRKGPAHYRELVRVPFLYADPTEGTPGTASDALAGTIDIGATILDRAQIHPYNGMQGHSLRPLAANPDLDGTRDAFLIEEDNQRALAGLGENPRARSLITHRWRLSVYAGHSWGELYDLEKDKGEFNNLWDSGAHRDIKTALLERLVQAQIAHCDASPAPMGQA